MSLQYTLISSSAKSSISSPSSLWNHRTLLEKTSLGLAALVLLINSLSASIIDLKVASNKDQVSLQNTHGDNDAVYVSTQFEQNYGLNKRRKPFQKHGLSNIDAKEFSRKKEFKDVFKNQDSLPKETGLQPGVSESLKSNICSTPGCYHTSLIISSKMNTNVDPCENFYRFACGDFLEDATIPDGLQETSAFTHLEDFLEQQLWWTIEEPTESNIKSSKLVKQYYNLCLNETRIEEQGLGHMKDILKKLGGWPVLEGDAWDERSFSWTTLVYKLRRYGYSFDYFMSLFLSPNVRNLKEQIINIDRASFGLDKKILVKGRNEENVKKYFKHMIDVAVIMGVKRAKAKADLSRSLDFEIKLAKISVSSEKFLNSTRADNADGKRENTSLPFGRKFNPIIAYHPTTIQKIQEKYPSIPWTEYINTILSPIAKLKKDEVVNVPVPEYIQELEQLLSATPKRVLANYAMWRVINESQEYLTKEIRPKHIGARWQQCLKEIKKYLLIPLASMYVRSRYFREDAKSGVAEIIHFLRKEMQKTLTEVHWMDDKTRAKALEKANAMKIIIGHPDELLDDDKLEREYDELEFKTANYLESFLNLQRWRTNCDFQLLRRPFQFNSGWKSYAEQAITINAYNKLDKNTIMLPAAFLQEDFFSSDRPNYINYASMGFAIGHEITHGFDSEGIKHDKDGNMVDWWTETSKKVFLDKAKCIIKQYGNYTIPELNLPIDGTSTQGDNIADNGGIQRAYNAYNAWVLQNGEEPRLTQLEEYSPRQMFWISAASTWCSKATPEYLKAMMLDAHCPNEFRIVGSFSNSERFSNDFHCPFGSKMNPVRKCHVW